MPNLLRFILTILLLVSGVLILMIWWIKRMNIPPDMRWPRKKQGRRRSERELPPDKNVPRS